MLGLMLFLCTSAVQGELFCTKRTEFLTGTCGDTISLPCSFSWEGLPFTNFELVWQTRRPGATLVVHHEDTRNFTNLHQSGRFRNRTAVRDGWPQSRDITVTLSNITGIDRGAYTCEIFTLTPYSRKICAEIQLDVHTDPVGLGLGISMTATLGASVHLPCFSRPGCGGSSPSLQTSWRFLESGIALEAELVSSARPARDAAGSDRISLSENGTLNLRGLTATNAGTYSCHLAGQRKVAEILLDVIDPVKIRDTVIQLVAFILIPVVAFLFVAGLIIGRKKMYNRKRRELVPNLKVELTESREQEDLILPLSDKNVNSTWSSTSSEQPLIRVQKSEV
ncbi:uncharacterized protein LOC115457827 [Microcaecilia unicolor]|uniref:Uncharacterized protein LOC115457827 n=1 Tax=Microcaecilia unicolor TaxID=1415580 RepID=A0A6P7WZH2_9AMPH|nr:uncharacterized protein LOC115457827 [Microcaecilia unicolor]